LLLCCLLPACRSHEGDEVIAREQSERLSSMRDALIGKSNPAFREVISENVPDRFVVLLIARGDCGTCLDKAFALTQRLDLSFGRRITHIILNSE